VVGIELPIRLSGGVEIVDLTLVVSLLYGPKLAPTSQ